MSDTSTFDVDEVSLSAQPELPELLDEAAALIKKCGRFVCHHLPCDTLLPRWGRSQRKPECDCGLADLRGCIRAWQQRQKPWRR